MATTPNTTTEQNKALVQYAWEGMLNKQNLAVLDETSARDFTYHNARFTARGTDALKQSMRDLFAAFPDGKFLIEDIGAWDDKVCVRYMFRGTHTNNLNLTDGTIPATGKSISANAMAIFRCENGKIAEFWSAVDDLGMMEQLGVIPTSG